MFRKLLLLLFSAVCLLALVTLPAHAGVQFEVTRWEVLNDVLNIEWKNLSNSNLYSQPFPKHNLSGDIFYLVKLPAWSSFDVLPGWTVDGDPGVAKGNAGGNWKIVGSMIVFEEGAVVTLEGDTQLTARFFGVTPEREKTLVMAHYVPFFQSAAVSGRYAYRWTLNREGSGLPYFHADETVNGQAMIASYQYPIAGVYDSSDPNLIRYHLALMKMSGIDGVILDFYGKHDDGGEYPAFLKASEELVKILKEADMKFAVCYEENAINVVTSFDKTMTDLEKAQQDFKWLKDNWFNDSLYISDDNRPVVLVFPSETAIINDWNQVIDGLGIKPLFVSRDAAEGVFNWMIGTQEHEDLSGAVLESRIKNEFKIFFDANKSKTYLIGTAFPAFDDKTFKDIDRVGKGKEQPPHGIMRFDRGDTFKLTLDLAMAASPDIVQLAVWNDHIEGTALEPTIDGYNQREHSDRGYVPLEYLQSKKRTLDTSFSWNAQDLRVPIEIYKLMVGNCATPEQKDLFDKAYKAVWDGNPAEFRNYARQVGMYGLNLNLQDSANLRKTVTNATGGRVIVKRRDAANSIAEVVAAAGEIVQVTSIDMNTLENYYVTYNGGKKITLSADASFIMPPYEVKVEFTETVIKPVINSSSLPNGTVGKTYSEQLTANGSGPIQWSHRSSLPTGLSLNESSGVISGTPSEARAFTFTIEASNSAGSDMKVFTVDISRETDPILSPEITRESLPGGTVGKTYNEQLTASGSGDIQWSVSSGSLPTGLSLSNMSGNVYGNPSETGSFTFTIEAGNSAGSDSQEFTVEISNTQDDDGSGGESSGGGCSTGGLGMTFAIAAYCVISVLKKR